MSSNEQFLDVPGAAEYLNVPERFARRLADERRVPVHKVGRYVRFRRSDLDAWLADNLRPAVDR